MSEFTCKNCVYCVEARQGHEIQKQYLCYRNPPTSHPIPTQGGIAVMSVRPVVTDTDWCGFHETIPTPSGIAFELPH